MFDAILLVSFGGPEGMADVEPFLQNVLRGKNVPLARMQEVIKHYERFGGVSPLNKNMRALIAALKEDLTRHEISLPIYWGNRNWHPLLTDTVPRMHRDGVGRALAFATSAYSSYSGCRQYLEDIERARSVVGDEAPMIEKIRPFFNHPLFIEVNVSHLREALDMVPAESRERTHVAFTAHSLPLSMAKTCSYEAQLNETARLVAEELNLRDWKVVYQSRSGPPAQPWLEPDILDHLRVLSAQSVESVVVAPIGFIFDHMEVIFDLDIQARQLCDECGLNMVRASTAASSPRFVTMVRELLEERLLDKRVRSFVGDLGPCPDRCPSQCCPAPSA
ncbi:MAG TPA: ferrochelatase [Candidatus Obscuribacterales bacterium]